MRVPKHIVDRRRDELRDLIRRDGFMPVAEICRRLDVSEATARRDLTAIEANGHITRTYGGALADYNSSFASLDQRSVRARTAKTRIAALAAEQIPATGVIFLDAGTTVLAIARALAQRSDLDHLAVVTNSLAVATLLSGVPGVELHVLGGMFLDRQAALMGVRAIRALGDWSFGAAFLGAEAMDEQGISNTHESVVAFQKALLAYAARSYFCLDASKLGHATPFRLVSWADISFLVTDAPPRRLAAYRIPLPAAKLLQA